VFLSANAFNSDLSEWNVAKVTNMDSSTFQFPLFNSLSTTCFLFLSLSPCSNYFVYFALPKFIKNWFSLIACHFCSPSTPPLSLDLLQCFLALKSSTQTSRNGTWPRSLTWSTVRFNSLSSLPHNLLSFSFSPLLEFCIYLCALIFTKNWFSLIASHFCSHSFSLEPLQCFRTLKSSTQTSRNGTWPRSLTWSAVRFNSLSLTPSPQPAFFFFSLSLCSNFLLILRSQFLQKNWFSLIASHFCSLSFSLEPLQCLIELKFSPRISWNGMWPRSLTCTKVRFNSLSSTPFPQLFLFFFMSLLAKCWYVSSFIFFINLWILFPCLYSV